MVKLRVEGIHKSFGSRKVLKDVSFELNSPASLGVTGHNGSGKSTLMKILAQIVPPTRGKVIIEDEGKILTEDRHFEAIKMVAPEMALYEMLTAHENLTFFSTLASMKMERGEQDRLLELVGLTGRGEDLVGGYSSGMKQRLKYAVALLAKPKILLLDEPTSNLDIAGKEIVSRVIDEQRKNSILIIATNENEDLDRVERVIYLDN